MGVPQAPIENRPGGPIADGYDNPQGTTPYPAPDAKVRPVGYWESEPQSVGWRRTSTRWLGSWGSTVFDLRTDLRGVNSREFEGTPINRTSAVQMWIAVAGLSNNHLGMRLLMSQWGHPVDGKKVKQFLPWSNVTADIATGTDLAILDYFPPGSGYQMRYWQVRLEFTFPLQGAPAQLPSLQVQAGTY